MLRAGVTSDKVKFLRILTQSGALLVWVMRESTVNQRSTSPSEHFRRPRVEGQLSRNLCYLLIVCRRCFWHQSPGQKDFGRHANLSCSDRAIQGPRNMNIPYGMPPVIRCAGVDHSAPIYESRAVYDTSVSGYLEC